jgi:hypothetical protein
MPRAPDPPIQIRKFLSVSKRIGMPFDAAWERALGRTIFPHDRVERHAYREAVDATKEAFRLAYHDHDVPGGRAALGLGATLEQTDQTSHVARPAVTPREAA